MAFLAQFPSFLLAFHIFIEILTRQFSQAVVILVIMFNVLCYYIILVRIISHFSVFIFQFKLNSLVSLYKSYFGTKIFSLWKIFSIFSLWKMNIWKQREECLESPHIPHLPQQPLTIIPYNSTWPNLLVPSYIIIIYSKIYITYRAVGKESACNAADPGWILGSGRSPGEGIGYPLQYSWASLVAHLIKNLPAMQEYRL